MSCCFGEYLNVFVGVLFWFLGFFGCFVGFGCDWVLEKRMLYWRGDRKRFLCQKRWLWSVIMVFCARFVCGFGAIARDLLEVWFGFYSFYNRSRTVLWGILKNEAFCRFILQKIWWLIEKSKWKSISKKIGLVCLISRMFFSFIFVLNLWNTNPH